ncbi:Ribonuclease P protein component 3 [Candidatus Methanobinarius endosymbioticus]|uniref:Ribonuclease P protein component 3 n=1 Tax=Candidatus Methanobinarius endosymbioticus TaxID=2006182 RepID=A0A366MBN8_9EURY|nr:Ribonuclease P protein component 3 [Candidatus Methanobinarius endosymbioticus]
MKCYDLNIKGNSYNCNKELILEAHRLGWDYFNLLFSPESYEKAIKYKNNLRDEIEDIIINNLRNKIGLEFGIEIHPKNQNELYKLTKKYRNKTKFISVLGGDLGVNRGVCENIQVDVLSRPYLNLPSCGINHVLAKEAVKNYVAIELCFNDILSSYLSYRSKIMAHFREIIKLHKKFKFPLIITSGASSIWEIRSPRDISAIFKYLDLFEDEFNNTIQNYPQKIIEFNNERENMIILGVKKI